MPLSEDDRKWLTELLTGSGTRPDDLSAMARFSEFAESSEARWVALLARVEALEKRLPPESDPLAANPHAVALGRLGASKGGLARADRLTAEQRSAIAGKAGAARWKKLTPAQRTEIGRKMVQSRRNKKNRGLK